MLLAVPEVNCAGVRYVPSAVSANAPQVGEFPHPTTPEQVTRYLPLNFTIDGPSLPCAEAGIATTVCPETLR
jgi:hypothetical protein